MESNFRSSFSFRDAHMQLPNMHTRAMQNYMASLISVDLQYSVFWLLIQADVPRWLVRRK